MLVWHLMQLISAIYNKSIQINLLLISYKVPSIIYIVVYERELNGAVGIGIFYYWCCNI